MNPGYGRIATHSFIYNNYIIATFRINKATLFSLLQEGCNLRNSLLLYVKMESAPNPNRRQEATHNGLALNTASYA